MKDDGPVSSRACRRIDRRLRSIPWLLGLILAVLGVVGCSEETGEGTGVAGEVSFDLAGQNDANISGARAVLHYVDEETTLVTVDGLDQAEQAGLGPNPVRIVEGSCDRPGAVAFQLPALTASGSEKRLKVGIDELYEGDYAVQVLFSKGRDEPMACGDVPDDPPDGS
jgi:hypothetical protein